MLSDMPVLLISGARPYIAGGRLICPVSSDCSPGSLSKTVSGIDLRRKSATFARLFPPTVIVEHQRDHSAKLHRTEEVLSAEHCRRPPSVHER